MEFTMIATEVKLIAQAQGIRLYQYLDDWLIRAKTMQICYNQTQALATLYKTINWVVNMKK